MDTIVDIFKCHLANAMTMAYKLLVQGESQYPHKGL